MPSRVRMLAALLTCAVSCLTPLTFASASDQPNDALPVFLDRALAASSEDSCTPGFIWQGGGNPNTTFQRKRNPDAGVELGIKGIIRQGPDIRSSYVDGDGLVHIEVPSGPQTPPTTITPRAAWNFTYSFNVGLDPANPDLSDYDAQLWIDLDPSEKVRYLKLTLVPGGPIQANPCAEPDLNGYQWEAGNTIVIPDDEGTAKVTQNSQNYAFYLQAIGDTDKQTPGVQLYDFGPAQFDVVLRLKKNSGDGGWTTLHVVFDVVDPPVPSP